MIEPGTGASRSRFAAQADTFPWCAASNGFLNPADVSRQNIILFQLIHSGETYGRRKTCGKEGEEKTRPFGFNNHFDDYITVGSRNLPLPFGQRLVEFHARHTGDFRLCDGGGRYVRPGKGRYAPGGEDL